MSDSEWRIQGGTLSHKNAMKEFGLSEEQIIQGMKSGKLQYRKNHAYPINTGCSWCLEMSILLSDYHPTRFQFDHLLPGRKRLCPIWSASWDARATRIGGLELHRPSRVLVARSVSCKSGEPVLTG